MNKKILFFLSALMLCYCFILSACTPSENNNGSNDNSDRDTYYTVTFDSQGGSSVESQRVKEGNPVAAPTSPTRENFDFDGWYLSASENAVQWNFSTDSVNEDITLYAHWTAKQEEEPPTPSETLTFEKGVDGFIVTGDSGQAANIVIPETHDELPVVGIADSAFAYSRHTSDILSVTIPDSVTEIGKNAFHNQDALVSVNIGTNSKLTKIGNNAFSGNSALESIYLPAGFTTLGDDVFNNCGGLNKITVAAGNTRYSGEGDCLIELTSGTLIRGSNNSVIPNSVTKIGVAAFRKSTLTELIIPTSVTSIEKYAFSDCAIVKVIYKGTSEDWENNVDKSPYWNMGHTNIEIVCSDTPETPKTNNILVAYFSCTGTTEKIANHIGAIISTATLYKITPAIEYTDEDLDYNDSSSRSTTEQRDANARPAISGSVENMESYDVIFLGYPIWWGAAPKIIYTFLGSYDFSGKTIVPFCTSASSGMGNSANDLHVLAPDALWQSGMRFSSRSTQDDVRSWLNDIGY